jgi:hypothetical protein
MEGWLTARWLGAAAYRLRSAAAGLSLCFARVASSPASWRCWSLSDAALNPVPGGRRQLRRGYELNYLDRIWLPGRKYDVTTIPKVSSTLPATTALLGLLAEKWITGEAAPAESHGPAGRWCGAARALGLVRSSP